jgi:hypothetical protein
MDTADHTQPARPYTHSAHNHDTRYFAYMYKYTLWIELICVVKCVKPFACICYVLACTSARMISMFPVRLLVYQRQLCILTNNAIQLTVMTCLPSSTRACMYQWREDRSSVSNIVRALWYDVCIRCCNHPPTLPVAISSSAPCSVGDCCERYTNLFEQ